MSVLLPFDCVQPFLRQHPLVAHWQLAPHDVFRPLVSLLAPPPPPATAAPLPPPPPCPHCAHRTWLRDAGQLVCHKCGACAAWIDPDNCRVYGDVPTPVPDARDVSELVALLREVDRYPGLHIALTADHLLAVARRASTAPRASRHARCAAALFRPVVAEFVATHDFATAIRRGAALPTLVFTPPPPPAYACAKCGVPVHEMWEVRRHACGWGTKKRRRVDR